MKVKECYLSLLLLTVLTAACASTSYHVDEEECNWRREQLIENYEHSAGAEEPDPSKLSLQLRSIEKQASFKLSTAPTEFAKLYKPKKGRCLYIFFYGFIPEPSWINFDETTAKINNKHNCDTLTLNGSPLYGWYYTHCDTFILYIADKMADLLNNVHKKGNLPEDIKIVGGGVAAWAAIATANKHNQLTNHKVNSITCLDPVNSCFCNLPKTELLLKIPQHVNVIHTDGYIYGSFEPIGDADFYPIFGDNRCDPHTLCKTRLAVAYYTKSIDNPNAFLGRECKNFWKNRCSNNTSLMGFAYNGDARGEYDLRMHPYSPYGMGKEGSWPYPGSGYGAYDGQPM